MDSIYFSKLMLNDYNKKMRLYEYAYAHLIYEYCKLNEIILLKDKNNKFCHELNNISQVIKNYKGFYAFKYLNYKHFIYYLIMKRMPKTYIRYKEKGKSV